MVEWLMGRPSERDYPALPLGDLRLTAPPEEGKTLIA